MQAAQHGEIKLKRFHAAFARNVRALIVAVAAMAAASPVSADVTVHLPEVAGPYDAVTVEVTGPTLDEAQGANPFADYRLNVTFSDGRREWTVPGYFAGCADAADIGCTGGELWRAHFVPDQGGAWRFRVSFRTGADLVAQGGPGRSVAGDGASGRFSVGAHARNEVRARGVLRYTGERYYRWSGAGAVSFKMGPDAPENTLSYVDFDATPNTRGLRKTWAPHIRDYDAASAESYTWAGGRGQGLLGMFNYLDQEGLNVVSMLLFNVGGDDGNVFPHLLRVTPEAYAEMDSRTQWDEGVAHDRFDVSKMAQWQRALSYADSLGLRLHFKIQEVENDRFMDGGSLGRERRIFLRELIARYGHFLGVIWNLGEENIQPTAALQDISHHVDAIDVYDHPIVMHTYPEQKERYRPLLGDGSGLNGLSMQAGADFEVVLRSDIVKWTTLSRYANRPWVIGYDEMGGAGGGAPVDPDYPVDQLASIPSVESPSREYFRRHAIWSSLTAGGEGVELYYGYRSGCGDLDCQDHRTRAALWGDARRALQFFERHVGNRALTMLADDELTANDSTDYVFADPGRTYVIFTASEEPVQLTMLGQTGRYSVGWYDVLAGGDLRAGSVSSVDVAADTFSVARRPYQVDLGRPPADGSGEWVILVSKVD
jgi:hypothetical protein